MVRNNSSFSFGECSSALVTGKKKGCSKAANSQVKGNQIRWLEELGYLCACRFPYKRLFALLFQHTTTQCVHLSNNYIACTASPEVSSKRKLRCIQ